MVLTPGQYTHHPRCLRLIAKLQRVVDEISMPKWMPGPCSGTTPILVRGPGRPRAGDWGAPPPGGDVPDPVQLCPPGSHPPLPSTRQCRL